MPDLIFSNGYSKKSQAFLTEYPQLVNKYKMTLLLLQSNPHHPSLRLHKLMGRLDTFFSVSIDLKYRVLIAFIIQPDQIILIDIGNYREIYGMKGVYHT